MTIGTKCCPITSTHLGHDLILRWCKAQLWFKIGLILQNGNPYWKFMSIHCYSSANVLHSLLTYIYIYNCITVTRTADLNSIYINPTIMLLCGGFLTSFSRGLVGFLRFYIIATIDFFLLELKFLPSYVSKHRISSSPPLNPDRNHQGLENMSWIIQSVYASMVAI